MSPVNENSAKKAAEQNEVPAGVEVFVKQGAFNMSKLPKPYQLIMKVINKKIAGMLKDKQRNAEEEATYIMATTGVGEPASWDVSDILAWAKKDWLNGDGKML